MILWMLVGVMTIFALAMVLFPVFKPEIGRKPLLLSGIIVIVPLVVILIYQKNGTPSAGTQIAVSKPVMPGNVSSAAMSMDIGNLAQGLAEKLKNQPNNAEGWMLLARTYVELKRHKEALPAYEKAIALLPGDPRLMIDYADALAVVNGKFDGKPEELIDQALKIDPANAKGLMLKATAEYIHKNYSQAIEHWKKILTLQGVTLEMKKEAEGSIDEAKKAMSAGK